MVFRSADEVNAGFIESGYTSPYKVDTEVIEFIVTENEQFVRVFYEGGSGSIGKWIVKQSDIDGKSPQQIKDLLALPGNFPPNKIVPVNIPSGIEMRTGTVAPNFGNSGGLQQFEILSNIDSNWFGIASDL